MTITGGRDSLLLVTEEPWRVRFRREDELVEQLQSQLTEALKRRGQALADGKAELGSVYKVAKELGRSYTVINDAIKKSRQPNRSGAGRQLPGGGTPEARAPPDPYRTGALTRPGTSHHEIRPRNGQEEP